MIKITQVRDGGNHVTQSTLTLDAWVERMKEEVKTRHHVQKPVAPCPPRRPLRGGGQTAQDDACRRVPQDGGRTVHEGL